MENSSTSKLSACQEESILNPDFIPIGSAPVSSSSFIRPKRIILLRHAESIGNMDEDAYKFVPDWKIPLTEKGNAQARGIGCQIKDIIGIDPIYIYTSSYIRTKQTLARMIETWNKDQIIGVRDEPRLSEQQYGNFQSNQQKYKEERKRFGRFFYRFPNGESGLDVYNRVTSFISTLYRDFSDPLIQDENLNMVIVTHGLTLRLFLMRFFKFTILDFEESENPPNCGMVILERKVNKNKQTWFEMSDEGFTLLNFKKQYMKGSIDRVLETVRRVEEEQGDEAATINNLKELYKQNLVEGENQSATSKNQP